MKIKRCSKCKKLKKIAEFHKNRHKPDGRDDLCIICRRAATNQYRRNAQGRRYGLDKGLCDQLLEEQNNSCAICSTSFKETKAQLDHDHATRQARGFLCNACNWGLGHFKDDVDLLLRAVEYLQTVREVREPPPPQPKSGRRRRCAASLPREVLLAAKFVEFWTKRVHTSNARRQKAIVRVIKLGKKHGLSLRDIGGVLKVSGQIVNYYVRRYEIE